MEPIDDLGYWKARIENAKERHHSVFRCPVDRWQRIGAKHREILDRVLSHGAWVLDAGCGYGRLVDMLPKGRQVAYHGVDMSPDFIEIARQSYPGNTFAVHDLRRLPYADGWYDFAILVSIRPMVKRNLGDEEWEKMEREVRRVSKKRLYLEYDENDEGSVE